ncbi:tRNA pseudouridine(55) synthase TruB [Candidatus Stoquefichus massiliensis]|uniref:tRNA pseudouridine(55) synthase TruB n=1 Tax=Candidatus Stoquefichus massiliensis TaxID=1470350 RepID=UPI000480F254|nr:tRNA pseudouridine(55) synthase TruB [Candidatus Stoquefichus massiliensis]
MDGILLINKTAGMTSHDVVNQVRRLLHTKKVGHCGTLDPDATGVLVLCIGKATKALQFLMSEEKEYIATLSLGSSTDTYDSSGTVIETKSFNGIENIETILQSFVGQQKQLPPMYSAIKVNGKKLYEYARKGETVEVEARDITIHEIELLKQDNHILTLRVKCSKGTYIRSLCVDIARTFGYPGHMAHLVRNQSGHFRLSDCVTLDDVEKGQYRLLSLEEAFKHFQHYIIEDENIVIHGKKMKSDIDHQVVVVNKEGKVLAVYGPDGQGYLKSIRGLF